MSLQLMKERMKNTGTTPRQSKIRDAHRLLDYNFEHDTAYADSVYFWIPGIEPKKGSHIAIKLYDKKYSSAAGMTVAFQTQITNIVEVGDYLYDESDNTYWICTESFNVEDIHFKGKLTQCNWHLKWQKQDGSILEYPCQDLNSTQYNSGESGSATIKLGSAQHMEIVQATEDTLILSSPQRFYVSRTNTVPFIVTQNDTTAYNYGKGLCKITVTQDQNRSEKDRPDLGICDYHSPTLPNPIQPDETTDLFAEISGSANLKVGFGIKYSVRFTNRDGNEVTDCNFKWDVQADYPVVCNVNGQIIELLVNDEDCIGSSFLLCVIIEKKIVAEKEITIIEGF